MSGDTYSLKGRTAIVTGGGSAGDGRSIGSAIAIVLARRGADVSVLDMDAGRAEQTVVAIEAEGGRAAPIVADVTSPAACADAVSATVVRSGRLDILVNNVGVASRGVLHELEEQEWDRVLDANLKGAVFMTRHALPTMIAAGRGEIVNVASVAGLRAGGGVAYGPSKAALIMHTQEVAVAYGRSGVRANVVAPGHVYTPLVSGSMTPEHRELRRAIAPLGVEGTAWDVASAVAFLASDEARFITGVCLPVDGGAIATMPLAAQRLLST